MNCELCDRKKVEHIGMMCGEHRICFFCIRELVSEAMKKRGEDG